MSVDEPKSTVVKVGHNGRITIPEGMRHRFNISEATQYFHGDLLEIEFEAVEGDKTATSFLEVGSGGRITIPEGIREYLQLDQGDLVKITVDHAEETDE